MTTPTALITGASSGIGYELAKLFAADGYRLILVARDKKKLHMVADEIGNAQVIALDLAKPGAAVQLKKAADTLGWQVDVLVNNAGFGHRDAYAEIDPQILDDLLQLNIVTLSQLTRLYLPKMLERKSGRIMLLASVAGFVPGPLMASYYASKAYVMSLGRALANEVAGSGVSVTTICPGATNTGFGERSGTDKTNLFKRYPGGSAQAVARAAYQATMAGKEIEIIGLSNKLVVFMTRFMPMSLVTKFGRNPQEQ